jgi:hypothetical protein
MRFFEQKWLEKRMDIAHMALKAFNAEDAE